MNLLPARAALAVNVPQPFGVVGGGTNTFSYAIHGDPGDGTLGTIDPATGLYTAPAALPPAKQQPIVVVATDQMTGATMDSEIYILSPLELVCDVIQQGLGLLEGRVYVYNQKISKPTDDGLFVAVGILSCKTFGVSNNFDPANNAEILSANMQAQLSIDVISRSTEALDRKEEVVLALNSTYARQQQELNSFKIAQLPSNFVNLSEIDGSAIPYRFNLTCAIQYMVQKTNPIPVYDTFLDADVVDVNP